MHRRDFLQLSALAAIQTVAPRAGTSQEDRLKDIEAVVNARMAEYHVPGVALGIIKAGRLETRVFGVTSVDNPQPITNDTVFPIMSITKTVGATAIMRLVQDGKLDVTAPVQRYLPDFRVKDESASRAVTVAHLLSQTPGWEGQLPTDDRGAETLAHFTSGLKDLPQLAAPGEVWSYNNAGFGVAGRIIEVVTGKTIHDALRELVFAPLDLTHAFTQTGTAMTHRFAVAHRQQQSGQTEVIRPFELPLNVVAGGGAMSIANLIRYAQFHLQGGIVGGKPVLSSALAQQMRTAYVKKNGTTDEMGLGWHLRRLNGVLTAAQGGTGSGHCLHVQFVPDRDLAFAILTNHAEGWRLVQHVERKILESYEKLAVSPSQATGGNRGVSEDMRVHATPLARQPALDQYAVKYERPPITSYDLRVEGGALRSGTAPGSSYVFYGPDVAYVASEDGTGGGYVGMPVEFLRNAAGVIGWIRVNGRIARKT
ncbi:MAG: serine hydrolase domain-containing protein [Vicinamibacterales bacterium]